MTLLGISLFCVLVGASGLAYVRLKKKEPGASARLLALAASSALVVSIGAALGIADCIRLLPLPEGGFPPTYLGFAALGGVLGVAIFLAVRVLGVGLAAFLYQWSCRLPAEGADIGHVLREGAFTLLGFVAVFVVMFTAVHAVAPYNIGMWLVPFFVALFPLYQTFALPWILFARAPSFTSAELDGIETWLERLRAERQLPRLRIRVQRGQFLNAFAIGGLGSHLIVVGRALVEGLPPVQLRAVVAHEIAHVMRRDVPRLMPLVILAAILQSLSMMHVVLPLFLNGDPLVLAAGALVAGLSAWAFTLGIPGFGMRRMEFGADRLAAELLGDGESLAQALAKLAELSGQPLDWKSWSHPPVQARIDALRAPAQ